MVNYQTADVEVTQVVIWREMFTEDLCYRDCTVPPKRDAVKGVRAHWILSFVLELKYK